MSGYTREQVELLVPTIWDRYYAWGMVNERPTDPDMPKSKGAKNQQNTLWAHLADIRRAWQGTYGITEREAQALVLCGGMGMTYAAAGEMIELDKRRVQEAFDRGVGRLVDYLNGTNLQGEFEDDEDD